MSLENKIIKLAKIIFLDNKSQHIVPIESIKYNKADRHKISPVNKNDFDRKHKYYVKYYLCSEGVDPCDDKHEHEYSYFSACICSLGESLEILKKESEGRTKIPNLKFFSTSESDDISFSPTSSKEEKLIKLKNKNSVLQERSLNVIANANRSADIPDFVDNIQRKKNEIKLNSADSITLRPKFKSTGRNISPCRPTDSLPHKPNSVDKDNRKFSRKSKSPSRSSLVKPSKRKFSHASQSPSRCSLEGKAKKNKSSRTSPSPSRSSVDKAKRSIFSRSSRSTSRSLVDKAKRSNSITSRSLSRSTSVDKAKRSNSSRASQSPSRCSLVDEAKKNKSSRTSRSPSRSSFVDKAKRSNSGRKSQSPSRSSSVDKAKRSNSSPASQSPSRSFLVDKAKRSYSIQTSRTLSKSTAVDKGSRNFSQLQECTTELLHSKSKTLNNNSTVHERTARSLSRSLSPKIRNILTTLSNTGAAAESPESCTISESFSTSKSQNTTMSEDSTSEEDEKKIMKYLLSRQRKTKNLIYSESSDDEAVVATDVEKKKRLQPIDEQPLQESPLHNVQPPEESSPRNVQPPEEYPQHNVQPPEESPQHNVQPVQDSYLMSPSASRNRSSPLSDPEHVPDSPSIISQRSHSNSQQINPGNKTFLKSLKKIIFDSIEYFRGNNPGAADAVQRYAIREADNKVYLGEGIYIPNMQWEMVKYRKKPSLFLLDLAGQLWTASELCNRALDEGKVLKDIPNRSPVKLIEKNKLRLLISLYADYLVNKKPSLRMSEQISNLMEVTSLLSQKIYKLRVAAIKAEGHRQANPRRRLRYDAQDYAT